MLPARNDVSAAGRRLLGALGSLGTVLLLTCVAYVLGTLLWLAPDLWAHAGICPPAPTDIPAYPCTRLEYLARFTIGGWALVGHVLLLTPMLLLASIGWAVWRVARASRSP